MIETRPGHRKEADINADTEAGNRTQSELRQVGALALGKSTGGNHKKHLR
ncbi:hypothetical protein CCP3SC1AL1_130001 [Gammaproteobacteria bacterium]